jgi:hypothetical protein
VAPLNALPMKASNSWNIQFNLTIFIDKTNNLLANSFGTSYIASFNKALPSNGRAFSF